MKKIILLAFDFFMGFLAHSDSLFKLLFKNERVILCYHNISSAPRAIEEKYLLNHSPNEFRIHLKILSGYFRWEDPKDLMEGNSSAGARVLFTFDDGFKGVLTEGLEVLREFDAPSLHFLNMGPILRAEPYWVVAAEQAESLGLITPSPDSQVFLDSMPENWLEKYHSDQTWRSKTEEVSPEVASKADLEAADSDRLVYFGNHLFNHFNAARLSESELEMLFKKNEKALSEFDSTLSIFAYPFGQPSLTYNQSTTKQIYGLGSKVILSACGVSNKPNQKAFYNRFTLSPEVDTNYKMKKSLIAQKLRGWLLVIYGKIDKSLVYP